MEALWMWPATGFGLGLSPWASGTVGSLLALPLAWWLLGRSRRWRLGLAATLLVAAMPLCQLASDTLGGKDDGRIVLDEIVAFPVAMLGQAAPRHPLTLAGTFVVFRLFDATKPPPVSQVEAMPGGIGIVLDDLVAALYAWALMGLFSRLAARLRRRRRGEGGR